ncbi:MAG TPA: hypothetical protein VN176_00840 [Verrucomicrobiae bacterium]|jgi:hypothetical protein|nr:hypothetical protein [Verrucomicrobiae bacterium]
MLRLRYIAIAVLLLGASLHAGDKKKQGLMGVRTDQTADLAPVKMVMAGQKCENWSLAAGLETLLQQQGVGLDQKFWVTRLSGNELCRRDIPTMESLADAVNQDLVLPGGRHVRLELGAVTGAPTDMDAIIAGIKQQRLFLLLWNGHTYYLTGVTYDEYIGGNGTRMFDVKELRLADTYPEYPATTFQKGRDNMSEIDGLLMVNVVPQ